MTRFDGVQGAEAARKVVPANNTQSNGVHNREKDIVIFGNKDTDPTRMVGDAVNISAPADAQKPAKSEEPLIDRAIKDFESGKKVEVPGNAYYDEHGNLVTTKSATLVKLSDGTYALKEGGFIGHFENRYYEPVVRNSFGEQKPTLMTGERLKDVTEAE